jgi:hypothetical protein
MSENAIEEVTVQEIIPVELPEQRYEFQPVDDEGRPIGGRQVIKYRTNDELRDQLVNQNTLLIRKLRKETRNNRLGISAKDEIPEDAPKYTGPIEFKPRVIGDDERYDISRRLLDPSTAMDATAQLLEAQLGAPLSTLGQTLSDIQTENLKLRARVEVNAFMQDNPDYYKCGENFEAITSWMLRYDLAPVKANFQKAYDTLKSVGALVEGPRVEIQAPVQAPQTVQALQPVVEEIERQEIPVEPVAAPPVTPVVRVPSGLTRDNSSEIGPVQAPGSDIVYEATFGGEIKKVNGVETVVGGQKRVFTGAAAIDAMPGEEYKRRLLHEPGFAKKVQALDEAALAARRAKRQ